MGKYAATRSFQRPNKTRDSTFNAVLGPINDGSDYMLQSFLYNSDPTGLYRGYLASRDNYNYMRDYLDNRGLKWSDIKYPSRTFGSDGGFSRSALMLSANIAKLY